MGHYLGEMESDEEYRDRAIYTPMQEALDRYDKEVKRGLVHTAEYVIRMEENRKRLREERGWDV